MGNEHILKEAPIGQLMIKLCVPTIVVMLVIVVYNMADIFFIGQTGDSMQVAALSLSTPLFFCASGIGTLLGSGAWYGHCRCPRSKKNIRIFRP